MADRLLKNASEIFRHVGERIDSPFSVELWDGSVIPLGPHANPNFRIRINGSGVIGAILRRPNLETVLRQYATGGIDFGNKFIVLKEGAKAAAPYASLADAKAAGAVTMNYGLFVNQTVTFLIIAACIFVIVRMLARLQGPAPVAAPATKGCSFCATQIPIAAKRCPNCTSQL